MRYCAALALLALTCAVHAQSSSAASPPAPASPPSERPPLANDPRYGLLTPIPEHGGLPRIYSKLYEATPEQMSLRAKSRDYAKQIRRIAREHFGAIKVEKIRAAGIAELAEFTDPAAFGPMIELLAGEKDDVRLAMLDHFAGQGDQGQAALAQVVIYDKDTAIRNEALRRMKRPAPEPVLYIVDRALRSRDADVANSAAIVVNALDIMQAIPLLIVGQVSVTQAEQPAGDVAWIAIQTQRAYVAGLTPVVGENSGGFQPVIGVVSEGAILRVVDAVAIEYRTIVHGSLVNLTTRGSGESTDPMGYNIQSWVDWYNNEYLPKHKPKDVPPAGSQAAPQPSAPAAPAN